MAPGIKNLSEMSDEELKNIANEQEKRREYLSKKEGMKEYAGLILKVLNQLLNSGFTGDIKKTAPVWVKELKNVYIELGPKHLEEAVANWARHDTNRATNLPKVSWILAECYEERKAYMAEFRQRLFADKVRNEQELARRETELQLKEDLEVIKNLPAQDKGKWIREHYSRRAGRDYFFALELLSEKYGIDMREKESVN